MTAQNNTSDTLSIVLAGRAWPIPRLAPKQNRIVVPALLELIPKIFRAREAAAAAAKVVGGNANVAPATATTGSSCAAGTAGCQNGKLTGNYFGQ